MKTKKKSIVCRWFGHRWRNRYTNGTKHRYCERCNRKEVWDQKQSCYFEVDAFTGYIY